MYNTPLQLNSRSRKKQILNITRSLNPNKAHGWDDVSVPMMKMCDDSPVLPLKLIFENCLRRGVFPEVWKRGNVIIVH